MDRSIVSWSKGVQWYCSGLLSGHLMATELHKAQNVMSWYGGELLHMAHDIGNRLLPAFNTSTGIPFPRVRCVGGMFGYCLCVVMTDVCWCKCWCIEGHTAYNSWSELVNARICCVQSPWTLWTHMFMGIIDRPCSTIYYDTIRHAISTRAWEPTWVNLIYRTETTTKKCKTEKLKSKNRYAQK